MIAGHLQEKKGYYYAVLSYKSADKKRKTKWIATGLPVKGNKKNAEAFLMEQRRTFAILAFEKPAHGNSSELFADYLQRWLHIAKSTIALTTYASYSGLLRTPIDPWFRKRKITLAGLTAKHIQNFNTAQRGAFDPTPSFAMPICRITHLNGVRIRDHPSVSRIMCISATQFS